MLLTYKKKIILDFSASFFYILCTENFEMSEYGNFAPFLLLKTEVCISPNIYFMGCVCTFQLQTKMLV